MLRPQDNAARERKNLNGIWQFRLDGGAEGRAAGWFSRPLADATPMAVPASFNDVAADAAVRDYFGDVWYQTDRPGTARLGRAADRVALRIRHPPGDVWVGDTQVVPPRRRLHPFRGRHHRTRRRRARRRGSPLVVNNTLSFQTIPPGVIEDTPDGPRQRYFHDFFNYAGLHRSVWLSHHRRRAHRPTSPSSPAWTAPAARVALHGRSGGRRRRGGQGHRCGTPTASEVAAGDGATGTLTVDDVHRWAPGRRLPLRPRGAAGRRRRRLVDSYHQNVGVRTVEVDGHRVPDQRRAVLLHGLRQARGHRRHRQGPQRRLHGARLRAAELDRRQLVPHLALPLLRGRAGLRRPARHRADRRGRGGRPEHGPRWRDLRRPGLHHVLAGDHQRRDPQVHAQAIRELVARDKNHPSVVLWSIANEPESDTEAAESYFKPLFDAGPRQLDPTRPVGFVNVMLAPYGKCRVSQFGDVLMLNRYYGWYVNTGELGAAEIAWETELRGWAERRQADHHHRVRRRHLCPGCTRSPRTPWTEEYQVEYLDMNHRVFDRIDAVVGEQVWNFADFATTSGIMRVGGNKKGVFTRDRQPKSAAFALRRRWRKDI